MNGEMLTITGLWAHENISAGLQGLSLALFTRGLGWSTESLEVFLADVRKDMRNPRIHSYWPMCVVKVWQGFRERCTNSISDMLYQLRSLVEDQEGWTD